MIIVKGLFAILLGLAIIAEIAGGIGILTDARNVMNEIEGILLFGFGTLTAATLVGARAIARTIEECEAKRSAPE